MQTALKNVFAQMSANGFQSFENFNGTFGWTDAEYRQLFESYGLHAVADHGAVDTGTWDARLEQAQRLGLKYVGSGGWPTGTNMDTVEGAVNMGQVLNAARHQGAGEGPVGLRPQPRRRVPHQAACTTSTATASRSRCRRSRS